MNQIMNLLILLFGIVLANPINQTDDDYNDMDDDDNSTRPDCCTEAQEAFLISTMIILVTCVLFFLTCGIYVCVNRRKGYQEIKNGNVQIPSIFA